MDLIIIYKMKSQTKTKNKQTKRKIPTTGLLQFNTVQRPFFYLLSILARRQNTLSTDFVKTKSITNIEVKDLILDFQHTVLYGSINFLD